MITILKNESADITNLNVSMIVNGTVPNLLCGHGVDAIIRKKGGGHLLLALQEAMEKRAKEKEEDNKIDLDYVKDCEDEELSYFNLGEFVVTPGFLLPCQNILHIVKPYWNPGNPRDNCEKLRQVYENCFKEAERLGMNSIAFSCMSTGVFAYPKDIAAEIAVTEAKKYPNLSTYFCCMEEEDATFYEMYL